MNIDTTIQRFQLYGTGQSTTENPQPSKNSTTNKVIAGITILSLGVVSYAYYQNQDYVNELVKEKANAGFDALKAFGKTSFDYAYEKSSQLYNESPITLERLEPISEKALKTFEKLVRIIPPLSVMILCFPTIPTKKRKIPVIKINLELKAPYPNSTTPHTKAPHTKAQ